jgi:Arc/MetJ family transcription regulator
MRTTVTLDDDVVAAVAGIRRERALGLSEAVNELIRLGLDARQARNRSKPHSRGLSLQVDVTDVPGALELLEGPAHR